MLVLISWFFSTDPKSFSHTLRLFHMTSVSGVFEVSEILNPSRTPDLPTKFPVLQTDLYKASQPALFLIDNGHEVFLWQVRNWLIGCEPMYPCVCLCFCLSTKCSFASIVLKLCTYIDHILTFCKILKCQVVLFQELSPLELRFVFKMTVSVKVLVGVLSRIQWQL